MSEDVIAVNNQRIGVPLPQECICQREVVFAVGCTRPTPEYEGDAWVFSGDSQIDEKAVKRRKGSSGGKNDNRATFAIVFGRFWQKNSPFLRHSWSVWGVLFFGGDRGLSVLKIGISIDYRGAERLEPIP
jgi:hypothetical protein